MTEHCVLLLEDESDAAIVLADFLELNGFEVIHALDGQTALHYLEKNNKKIDLAILDIMVPHLDGYQILQTIRENPQLSELPVIFLTAKDQLNDEIKGLSIGADDYIRKPASLNLILARIRSILRRTEKNKNDDSSIALNLDHLSKTARIDGKPLPLTLTEFQLLACLYENPSKVFSRQELVELLHDEDKFVFDRTVDAHIKNLRLKLESYASYIKTYRGIGYGWNDAAEPTPQK